MLLNIKLYICIIINNIVISRCPMYDLIDLTRLALDLVAESNSSRLEKDDISDTADRKTIKGKFLLLFKILIIVHR